MVLGPFYTGQQNSNHDEEEIIVGFDFYSVIIN